jgi:molecular chaperone GrpE
MTEIKDKGKTVKEKENTAETPAEDQKTEQQEKTETKKPKKKIATKEQEQEEKIKALEQRLSVLETESQSLKDQLLRKIAEFENYKRRTEKEFIDHLEFANVELILEILPVIDDFERSLQHMEESKDEDSHLEGIRLIYKKLFSTLEKRGLKPIDSVGEEFDPEQHQALMQVESDKYESGHIVEEHLKGYKLNDKVIRHSQVLVAK